VHCANTGSMRNCLVEESPCWISDSHNLKRKYRYSLEVITTSTGHVAGINTGRANQLVAEALEKSLIPQFRTYTHIQPERKYGQENSRVDFFLSGSESLADCYLEVKSVTLGEEGGLGLFPDSVSDRASRHVRELREMLREGQRAALLFCVQHSGIESVSPAKKIDPGYAQILSEAAGDGLEVLAWRAKICPREIVLLRELPVLL